MENGLGSGTFIQAGFYPLPYVLEGGKVTQEKKILEKIMNKQEKYFYTFLREK